MSYYDKADLIYLMSGAAGSGGNGTSKVYSLKGDTDIVYNRGADIGATRIAKDGTIEKGRENLALHSNTFNNAVWGTQGSGTTLTSGSTGYDGTSDAWQLTVSGESGNVNQSLTTTGVKTISVYAKSVSGSGIRIYGNESGGSNHVSVFFTLTGDGSVSGTPDNSITQTITKVGNDGWYRCSVTFDKTLTKFYFYVTNGGSSNSTDGTVLIQDAQAEVGLVATGLINSGASTGKSGLTIDEPRFNYPALGSGCPKLLMEQKRTNKATYSEYFGAWTATDVTVENNAIISPEGVKNATKLVIDNGVSSGAEIRLSNVPVLNATSYTFSLFVKAGEFDEIQLDLLDSRFGNANITADLSAGTFTSGGGSTNAEMVEHKDGWFRLILVGTTVLSGTTPLILRLQVGGINGTGDGSKGIYVYGAQFEHGVHVGGDDDGNEIDAPYPTSYIPTHGTAVTRDQDGHTNPTLVNTDADQFSFFVHTSQGETVGSNRGPRLYHSTTDGTKNATCGYFINTSGNKVMFLDSNAGSGSDRNISKNFNTPADEDHEDFKYLFCVDNIELRARLFVDGELFCDTARPTTSGATVRAMTERADFDKLRLTSSADVGEPDELTSVMTFNSSLSNTEGKILTGATSYVSFGAMTDALTNYTTYE